MPPHPYPNTTSRFPGQPNAALHPANFLPGGPPPCPPQFRPIPLDRRQSLDSEKLFQLVIIKYDNTSLPSMHSFPVDSDALPDRLSLRHLSSLTSGQLDVIDDTLNDMNAKLAEVAKAKKEKGAKEAADKERESKKCEGKDEDEGDSMVSPLNYQGWELAQESDYEKPWVLEGIEIELEPETIYKIAKRTDTGRSTYLTHGQEGHNMFNSDFDGAWFGIHTWKPTPGVKKEIVVVFSRLAACRGYRRGFGGSRWRGVRAEDGEEVWKVCGDAPMFGTVPRATLDMMEEQRAKKDARIAADDDFVDV
ncbi:hypothetical protein FPQ18DRAFT_322186 [Pyronema domesticum]|uniref:Uncharacterized protein n=1 Tax=Pyronema omphalodes (strain CBS 100304) TaxID=1076935 RepID=U4LLC1_PYROM|nr:hypothetical protein FPQ18DRAFT_322186 [Pyronema domesticum]CCX32733.1 Protein of unknown function [Pyronema omphalodes CBS 100304]